MLSACSWSNSFKNHKKKSFFLQNIKKMMLLQKSYRRCFSSSKTITNRRAQILRGEYPNSGKVQTTEMSFVDTENEKRGSIPRSRWEGRKESAVVFLHGNPTSSYLWRDVIPSVSKQWRCLAPDLVGMGSSGPSTSGHYTFSDHSVHLDSWFDGVLSNDERVHLVLHDWGSALGFHWARRNAERVASITVMEGIVRVIESWDEFPESGRKIFQAMRTDNVGEELVLEKNVFVEKILPASIMRTLEKDEMDVYRAPFDRPETRLPTLVWPRQIPIRSEGPSDVVDVVDRYNTWLKEDSEHIPKLLIDCEPGFFAPMMRDEMSTWKNVTTPPPVPGIHFIQEDSGKQIGDHIAQFLSDFI